MRAMVLDAPSRPLRDADLPRPEAGPGQFLIKVHACAVCRTDLHVVDGDLTDPGLPIIPGHEIVGTVVAVGAGVDPARIGERVGVPWLGWTCGDCGFCRAGRENLCDRARFTGYQIHGGYRGVRRRGCTLLFPDSRWAIPMSRPRPCSAPG